MPTVIVSHKVQPGQEAEYQSTAREINLLVRDQPGFAGVETLPPVSGLQDDWAVIFRFTDNAAMQAWLDSPERKQRISRLEQHLQEPVSLQVLADTDRTARPVAVVFAQKLRSGEEENYRNWQKRLSSAQMRYKGYLGTEVFEPAHGLQEEWVNIVRFDTPEHLEAWLKSSERKALLKEAEAYIEHYRSRRLATGLEGWFEFSKSAQGSTASPLSSWKQAVMVLAALYPTVMILHYALSPFLTFAPRPLVMLIMNIISVSLLTWVCMPFISKKLLRFWIDPSLQVSKYRWIYEAGGWLLVIISLIGFLFFFLQFA